LGYERGGKHDKVGEKEVYLGFLFKKILVIGQWNGSFWKKRKSECTYPLTNLIEA